MDNIQNDSLCKKYEQIFSACKLKLPRATRFKYKDYEVFEVIFTHVLKDKYCYLIKNKERSLFSLCTPEEIEQAYNIHLEIISKGFSFFESLKTNEKIS